MSAEFEMTWSGKSGKVYKYYAYKIGVSMKAVPANYIFAKI